MNTILITLNYLTHKTTGLFLNYAVKNGLISLYFLLTLLFILEIWFHNTTSKYFPDYLFLIYLKTNFDSVLVFQQF